MLILTENVQNLSQLQKKISKHIKNIKNVPFGSFNPLDAKYVNLRVCEIGHAYIQLNILRFPKWYDT